jgi:Glycosyl hydrolases family 32 N-terminal domain
MFRLPEAWVWDFWLVDDGQQYHLFFLYASRALKDPEHRHYRASIGHAVSRDLVTWERVADALVRSDPPAFDDLATWTGSVIRHPDGTWYMFYTGATLTPGGNVQTIGYATSPDLLTWEKNPTNPVLAADSRWYEKLSDSQWHDEAFRDPWVVADPDGEGWHMLITARANQGPPDDRGVIGHAWSPDLITWDLRPPVSAPGYGFAQLEVTHIAEVDGRLLLMFSCLGKDLSREKRASTSGGIWVATAESLLGPYDLGNAQLITKSDMYVGRLIKRRETGQTVFLAFHHDGEGGDFIGEIIDPRPVVWDGRALTFAPTSAQSLGERPTGKQAVES